MMRLPRDLSGKQLGKALGKLGYLETRQVGSHVRYTTQLNGTHHITVPHHDFIRIGTLAEIFRRICEHHRLTREELLEKLF